nr:MAG TPA: hypothetical protein [Caudoviricetes sp.]
MKVIYYNHSKGNRAEQATRTGRAEEMKPA